MTAPQPNHGQSDAGQSAVRRFALHCRDGVALRAEEIQAAEPRHARVVLCHPHPLHGGNMHSHVIGGLFSGLPAQGVTTLRFNFRGTSGSEGQHDGGQGEQLDVMAAIDHLNNDTVDLPLFLVGYSFGARVCLTVEHPAIAGWIAIAPPLSMTPLEPMQGTASSSGPKHLIVGENDDFCPPENAAELTSTWRNTTITPLPGQDHFMATASASLLETIASSTGATSGPA